MIMKKVLVTLCFITQFIFAQSPGFNWADGNNGPGGNDFGLATITDAQGNIYSTGAFKFQVDFDPGPANTASLSAGLNDLYVQKLSPTGNLIWVIRVGAAAEEIGRGIAIDPDGNVLVTGNFSSATTDFDPGAGVTNLTCNGASDVFVLKLTSAGNFLWAKSIGGIYDDFGYGICSDSNSGVIVGGHFGYTVDFDPGVSTSNMTSASSSPNGFLLKLDASGNFIYSKQIESTYSSTVFGVKCNSLGQIGIAGSFSGDIDIDPSATLDSMYSINTSGFFVLLDNSGNFVHGHINNGGPYYAFQFDANNHIALTGYSISFVDLDPGPGITYSTPNANNDAFVVRLRPNGNFVFGKSIAATGWENGFGIDVDGAGNIISIGNFSGTGDFDPGPGVQTFTGNGNYDIFIHKFDTAGNFVWCKQIGGTGDDQPKGISVDPFGNIAVTGYYNGTVDFDPSGSTTNLTSGGGNDIYIVRFQCSQTSSNVTLHPCDVYTSPSGRYTWTVDGTYQDTITNVSGCDSVINITLGFLAGSSSTINANVCNSYLSPSGFYTWNSSGTYQDTISNHLGCDSVITINLSVTNIDTSITIINGVFTVGQSGGTYQWGDCIAQIAVPGEVNQSFTPIVNGSYAVIINYNGCTDTTSCYSINDVGLNENSDTQVQIYPNPVIETINLYSDFPILSINIVTIDGKLKYTIKDLNTQTWSFDTSSFPTGIYLIEVVTTNGRIIRKIIKSNQ